MIQGGIILALIYYAFAYGVSFIIQLTGVIRKPFVNNGFALSVLSTLGVVLAVGGIFVYSYVGHVWGVLCCFIGVCMGGITVTNKRLSESGEASRYYRPKSADAARPASYGRTAGHETKNVYPELSRSWKPTEETLSAKTGDHAGATVIPDQTETRDIVNLESAIELLDHEDWHLRSDAADALSRFEDPSALGYLLKALDDKDWHVRCTAADSLGVLKDSRAIAPLTAALDDKDKNVRRAASDALKILKESQPSGSAADKTNTLST